MRFLQTDNGQWPDDAESAVKRSVVLCAYVAHLPCAAAASSAVYHKLPICTETAERRVRAQHMYGPIGETFFLIGPRGVMLMWN